MKQLPLEGVNIASHCAGQKKHKQNKIQKKTGDPVIFKRGANLGGIRGAKRRGKKEGKRRGEMPQ